MKQMYLYLIIILGSVFFNYHYGFGFFFKNGEFTILWLFFYTLLLPIGSMLHLFNNYASSSNFRQSSLFVFLVYLFSVFVSAFEYFDFKNFTILGDGETKFVISSVLIVCFISACSSFFFTQIKNISK
jgi:hypothetical protein